MELEPGISHQISITSPSIARNITVSDTEDRPECGSQSCLFLKHQLRKEAFLMTLGRQCLCHPRESARMSAGWALSKKGVTGSGAHAFGENQWFLEWFAP